MCGIVGYAGPRRASPILLDGLKRLEYRGYDSAGIAVGRGDGSLASVRCVGKIQALKEAVPKDMAGTWGIGHTRWATHGGVTQSNAHPHFDSSGKIAVAHNGIIENYRALREMLRQEGVVFYSETDTEVIPNLVAKYYEGDLEAAVKAALVHLEGTYGIAVIHADEPGRIVGARNGSPLVVGVGEGRDASRQRRDGLHLQHLAGRLSQRRRGGLARPLGLQDHRPLGQPGSTARPTP